MGDRQTFQVMPSAAAGTPDAGRTARALPFRHENETARPYYYGVTFENGLKAEMAPTDHAARLRFTYPGDDASAVFDNVNDHGGLTLDADDRRRHRLLGRRSGLSTGATRLFVYGVVRRAGHRSGSSPGGGDRTSTGYRASTPAPTGRSRCGIATSLISIDQAKNNLAGDPATTRPSSTVKTRAQRRVGRPARQGRGRGRRPPTS